MRLSALQKILRQPPNQPHHNNDHTKKSNSDNIVKANLCNFRNLTISYHEMWQLLKRKNHPHAAEKSSCNWSHFPNDKKDNHKYKTFGQHNPGRDHQAKEGNCFLCKKPGHVARDCPTRNVSSRYVQVNRKPTYKVKTARLSIESEVDTSHLEVMRPTTDSRNAMISGSQEICNVVDITIHAHNAPALIDPCTINADLISANFCFFNRIPTKGMDANPLETAIRGSRSTITKKPTVELNIQGNKISRTLYVSNLTAWDAIIAQPVLATLNVIMDVKNDKVSILHIRKARH